MKLFEIGDGLKSIEVPDNYYTDWEGNDIVVLYDPYKDFAEIRISVLTVEPKDNLDTEPIYWAVVEKARENGQEATIVNNKSYYTYNQQSEAEGEDITLFFFEIGYKCHYILISITVVTAFAQNNEEKVKDLLSDVRQAIATIEDINLEKANIFEPKYNDFTSIEERVAAILDLDKDDIDAYHQDNKTLPLIQAIIDEEKYSADDTYELQSLGVAFGSYLEHINNNLYWAIIRDEYGRDICLHSKNLAITVFPLTMLSKRIEEGASIDVEELKNNLIARIDELSSSGDFTVLQSDD